MHGDQLSRHTVYYFIQSCFSVGLQFQPFEKYVFLLPGKSKLDVDATVCISRHFVINHDIAKTMILDLESG